MKNAVFALEKVQCFWLKGLMTESPIRPGTEKKLKGGVKATVQIPKIDSRLVPFIRRGMKGLERDSGFYRY